MTAVLASLRSSERKCALCGEPMSPEDMCQIHVKTSVGTFPLIGDMAHGRCIVAAREVQS